MIEAKRKQHHVWKHYLSAWSIEQKIWVYQQKRCFNSSLQNIAQERDFYKLKKLTDYEISYIKTIIGQFHPHLQKSANEWLETFIYLFNKRDNLNELFKNTLGLMEFINTGNETDVLFKTLAINFEEDLHCRFENRAKPILDKLLKKDTDFFFNLEDKLDFIHFMCIQYTRTKAIKQNILEAAKLAFANHGVNLENMWSVLSHIFAENIASNLIDDERFKLIILENATNVELITGDQPMINTFSTGKNWQANDTEFYYPISPKFAILLTKSALYLSTHYSLTFEDVNKYNKNIIEKSNLQIFASLPNTLSLYLTN